MALETHAYERVSHDGMPISTLVQEPPRPRFSPQAAMLATVVIALFVVILDYVTPADYDVGVFYGIAIATSAWSGSRKFLWAATSVFLALVLVGALVGVPPNSNWLVVGVNRSFTALALVIIAALVNRLMIHLATVETQRTLSRRLLQTLDFAQVIIRTIEGKILFWSYGAELLYGWSNDEAVGKVSHELLRTMMEPDELEEANRRLRRDWQWTGELRQTRKSGSPLWVASQWTLDSSYLFPFPIVTEVNNDITILKASENRSHLLTELVPNLVWQVSSSGRITYVNQRWLDYFGRDSLELTSAGSGMTPFEHPDDAALSLLRWPTAGESDRMRAWKVRYRRHDGAYRWFECRALPVHDESGTIVYWIGTAADVHPE